MAAILCRGLGKQYGTLHALRDLDLSVPEGGIFGFLGPNGAGKTTAIRILATLSRPSSGEAWVAGSSVREVPGRARQSLGYLPQDAAFPKWMTGREYLEFAAELSGVPARERRPRATAMLERVGLAEAAGRRVGGYSGGMCQRLGIAQALIHRPSVLILDEPVSALDPLGRREVLTLIAGLRGESTVFFSSHILDDIDRICDHVAILSAGRLLAQEETARLKDRYAQPVFEIEVAGPAALLAESLAGEPWVLQAAVHGSLLRVLVSDLARAERELPRLIVAGDLTLLRYEQILPSLEDVFVKLVQPGQSDAA